MSPSRSAALLTLLVGALAAAPRLAAARQVVPPSEVPDWVREASARPVPKTDARLVWLHQEEIVEPLLAGGVRTTHRVVAKCLRPEGLEELGTRRIAHMKDDTVESVRAWTLLADGSARLANRKDDMEDEPIARYGWMEVYSDSRVRRIQAPSVAVGSIVAYEDVVIAKLDWGATEFLFGHAELPTVFARFTLRVPAGWAFEPVVQRGESLERGGDPGGFSFTGRSLDPLRRVEERPPDWEVLPKVWARWWSPDGRRGFREWKDFARWYWDLASPVLSDRGEAQAISQRLRAQQADGPLGAIRGAFDFAAREIRYVAIALGIGGWKPDTPAAVCKNKYGDCKAKSFLLMSLLGSADLKTYPVLVRTRDLGRLDAEAPGNQFNHCITAVVLPEGVGRDLWAAIEVEGIGRVLFLDGTVWTGRAWDLRDDDQGTLALLVHPERGKLVRLPVQPPDAARRRRSLEAGVDEAGRILDANLVESWEGTAAQSLRLWLGTQSAEDRRRHVAADLQERFSDVTVREWELTGLEDVEGPVTCRVRFAGGRMGKRVGELLLLEPGRLAHDGRSWKLPPPPRQWPYEGGPPYESGVEVKIDLPAGWHPEEVPASVKIRENEVDGDSEWEVTGGRLTYRRNARIKVLDVPPERYEAFRTALRRVEAEDARAVVLIRR